MTQELLNGETKYNVDSFAQTERVEIFGDNGRCKDRLMTKELEPTLENLNHLALERVDKYHNLMVGNTFVNTPFFINQIERWYVELMQKAEVPLDQITEVNRMYREKQIPFGWYKGKGTPEELEQATQQIAEEFSLDLTRATPVSAAEFMKYIGLGIDCSGLVTNCLQYAFDGTQSEGFLESLDIIPYEDGSRSKYRTGVFSYRADSASYPVEPKDLRPLDILVRGGWHDMAWHMGIVLEKEDSLILSHSTLGLTPNGVHSSILRVEDNKPVFGFTPNLSPVDWEDYYDKGVLGFRRLRFVDDVVGKLK